jgi:hypothetical protein
MDYLQPQSFESIFRNSFSIYFRHWPILVAVGSLVLVPIELLDQLFEANGGQWFGNFFDVVAQTFLEVPMTVAISDICIGLKPGVKRSYQRAFNNLGVVVGTIFVLTLLTVIAIALFIIPGLVVLALYLFVSPVVILEQRGGKAAFKRSRELGRGFYLRNLGVFLLIFLIIYLPVFLLDAAFVSRSGHPFSPSRLQELVIALIGLLLYPLVSVPPILLYYDMRARKEDYGAPQLAEDLMR